MADAAAYRDAVLALAEQHHRRAKKADARAEQLVSPDLWVEPDWASSREYRAAAALHRQVAGELHGLVADVEQAAEAGR